MMNSHLFYALWQRASGRTFLEDAKEAGTVTLLGMVAIFAVLALLWLVIEILHRTLTEQKDAAPQQERKKPVAAPAPKPQPTVETVTPAAPTDDGALIAAITAAISAALAEEGYTGGFRVVSFKRSSRKSGRN